MSVSRIYSHQALGCGLELELGKDAARHLVTVLRHRVGDSLTLFNGDGGEYSAVISAATHKSVIVNCLDFTHDSRESPLTTLLAIGISKGERFEWVLQKATELGVSGIFPLYTERTEVKLKGERQEKKQQRWQHLIISACEQCGRNIPPVLHSPQSLDQWLNLDLGAEQKLLLHHRSTTNLASLRNEKVSSAALLVGPEGGLSAAEIERAQHQQFASLTLGPRIFRTETAPVVALSLLQGLWGDF